MGYHECGLRPTSSTEFLKISIKTVIAVFIGLLLKVWTNTV